MHDSQLHTLGAGPDAAGKVPGFEKDMLEWIAAMSLLAILVRDNAAGNLNVQNNKNRNHGLSKESIEHNWMVGCNLLLVSNHRYENFTITLSCIYCAQNVGVFFSPFCSSSCVFLLQSECLLCTSFLLSRINRPRQTLLSM